MFKTVKNKSRLLCGLVSAHTDTTIAKFVHYYGPSFEDNTLYDINDLKSLLCSPKYNHCKSTILYIHGYLENCEVESIQVIVDAYLRRNDVNLIVLDWSQLADGNYIFDAATNAKQLGIMLGSELISHLDSGLDLRRLHIVGHSLGAQLAGIIGRTVYQESKKCNKIGRITGLDPAFPLFYMVKIVAPLNKDDAEFVDIIHTDAWIYGAPFSTGTADFWPNGGKTLQPGCPKRNYKPLTDNDLSSHRRSWWFWAESVIDDNGNNFNAVKAKSWNDFKNNNILPNDANNNIVMGHNCSTMITGDFYLQTNGSIPFARGVMGTKYIDPECLPGYKYNATNTTL